ncbi:MAG: PEP/pyruvate-binding domain-containing protein [bacterium]
MTQDEAGRIPHLSIENIPVFDRRFFESDYVLSRIGGGAIGGKASGLAFAHQVVRELFPEGSIDGMEVSIPRFVVIGTDVYDAFMERNELYEAAKEDIPDERMAMAFLRAEFPTEFVGDIRALVGSVHSPLAARSSSCLEDALYEPFAGVYGTKMIPNNQPDTDTRYRKLIEAIKFVYSSASFREAKGYLRLTGRSAAEEKMAVIIQEVLGSRHGDRYYPNVSGVGRSYNFYPVGSAEPEEGVVDLALGLGKTIVDGGQAWTYSPAHPRVSPPFTTKELLRHTQTEFWAVNLGKPSAYDPVKETEYLIPGGLVDAEQDDVLSSITSTYVAANDRLVMGMGVPGSRVLDFAPLLRLGTIPFNEVVTRVLKGCRDRLGAAVEIELAVVIEKSRARFGLLQVRPMVVSTEKIEISQAELTDERALLASVNTLGNGTNSELTDIIYVRPDVFAKEHTRAIAAEIDQLNREAQKENRSYVLMGFGRWGSSDPWLGIPVDWGNISGARVIVEATLPDMNVEMSQGSHFFHNITSLQIPYLNVAFDGSYRIDWVWLEKQRVIAQTEFVRYVRADAPLTVRLDGRSRRGVILR